MKAIFFCAENTPRILGRCARSRDSKLPGASIFENAIESIPQDRKEAMLLLFLKKATGTWHQITAPFH